MLPHAVLLLCLLLASTTATPVRRDTESTSPGKKKDLDVYSFHIKSTVSSRYAMTVITSRVANRANESREVVFHVELPKNAFISKFSMNMDGRVYDGVVKKKEEAQSQYTQAVSRGQSAGLVSAVGRTLEEFKTSVTVAAFSKVTFELTYEELLKRKLGQYQLLIKARPSQIVKDFKVEVTVSEQQGIAFLKTEGSLIAEGRSSALKTTVTEKEALVQFTPSVEQQCPSCGDTGLNGDLLLIYDVNRPQSKGEIQVSQGYFVHYFAPTGLPRIPKNVVFIIDRSGSMHGRKIEQTREALLKILGDIPEEDHFGLITFDDSIFTWKPDLVPATSDYLAAASTFVKGIQDRGSTDINQAVLEGVKMLNRFNETHPQNGTASILILLTDGDPTSGVTNLKTIQANVREAIGKKYTLYCLGFGFDVNYEFLEKMALENEGVARRIYADSDAALQLQGFYEEVATPLLLDIHLHYTGVSNLTQTHFAHYYNGSEIVVAGQVTDNDVEALTAEVKGNKKGEAVVFQATLDKQKVASEIMDLYIFKMYIQRLWAYLTVQQHMERALLLTGEEKSRMNEEALALALKYSFVTPVTSMVVTKPEGEQQVAHKPKEGKQSNDRIVSGRQFSRGMIPFRHGLSGGLPNVGSRMAFLPAPAGPGMHRPGLVLAEDDVDSDLVLTRQWAPFRPLPVPAVLPTVIGHQKTRLLLPALSSRGHTSARLDTICFDLDLQGESIFRLMEDRTTDLLIAGQVSRTGQKGFSAISIRMGQGYHMQINTTTITFGADQYSYPLCPARRLLVRIGLMDRLLDMLWGDVVVKILLHENGGDYFLWPDIRGTARIFHGLIGLLQGGLVEKHTTAEAADIHIQGHVITAFRDTAVDYGSFTTPNVDCWLFQYQSALQGKMSHLLLPRL